MDFPNRFFDAFGRYQLAKRIMASILLLSFFLAMVATTIQLTADFRKDMSYLEEETKLIEHSYVRSIENGVWYMDSDQVQTLIQGINQLVYVHSVDIQTSLKVAYHSGGEGMPKRSLLREFPLMHGDKELGALKVNFSLDQIYGRLWSRLAIILATNFVEAAILMAFFFTLFHHMVSRHLDVLASYARRLHLGHLDVPLVLEKPHRKVPDEIDDVVQAVNEMRNSLKARTEELQLAKESAEQASRAKSVFLATMSHELLTPLNHVLLYSELLKANIADPEDAQDLARIQGAVSHLQEMIHDILNLVNLEAGKTHLTVEVFVLADLLAEIRSQVLPLAESNGNVLVFPQMLPKEVERLELDSAKLRQVLLCLLGNACKFTRNGSVSVEVEGRHPSDVVFHVIDTGIGIPAHQIELLFKDFVQVDQSYTREYGGIGLGLAICKRLCALMGGEISVQSTPGNGSAFTVRLPKAEPIMVEPSSVEPALG